MLIPRRITFPTWTYVLFSAALSLFVGRLGSSLGDAWHAVAEAEQRIAYTEARYTECSFALDRYDTIVTQCLAWQGRLSLDVTTLARACAEAADGGAW